MNALIKKIKSRIPIGLFKLFQSKIVNVKFPHAIQLNLTFKCNQRCEYCGIYTDKRYEMTTEEVFKMIDEFVALGTSRISLTGGEPLTRKDFQEIVSYARKKGLFVSLATNGTLVAKRIEAMKDLSSVNMTLDGPEAIHNSQRGKDNFKKVIEAVKLIKSKGIPVYLVTVITKNNCDIIDEILSIARSLDVRLVIQPVFYSEQSHAGDLEGYKNTKYEDQAMIKTIDKLIKLKERDDPTIMLSKRYYRDVKRSIEQGTKMVCVNGGSLFCTISPDGRVAPCNLLVRDRRWLNGNEIGFREAFINMPEINCGGCISSFMDFDSLYSLKPDVVWNYYKHFLKLVKH
ncbi:MAG: radical SAM protein [Colwellia sp.]|nr:radical SAM protein [Colwellia sp.]